jgi:ankyrin repeat protein
VLKEALGNRDWRLAQALLDHGADVDQVDADQESPLAAAVSRVDLRQVRWLLERGADPRQTDRSGVPVLSEAVRTGGERGRALVERLLRRGADPNRLDHHGYRPLFYALGDLWTLRLLLRRGADPDLPDGHGSTVLQCVLALGRRDLLEALLRHGVCTDGAIAYCRLVGHSDLEPLLREHGAVDPERR